ncbi:MAG: SCO family protein [bacterium]
MTDTTTQPAETDYSQLFESKSFWLFVVGVLFSLPLIMSFMRPKIEQKPILGSIQEFKLQNQDGRDFSNRDIAGSVLLVNFVFTSCPSTCPMLTKTMADVQVRLKGTGKSVQLLTVTVDPEHDTPEVLKSYAKKHFADLSTWSFITGSKEDIRKLVVGSFASPLSIESSNKPDDMSAGFQIAHGEHFVLVDQLGRIRSYEHINNPKDINRVMRDIAILVNTPPKS